MHNEDDKIQFYWAFVPNSFQYDAVIKTIAKGLSLCQTTDVYEEYQDMTGMTSEMGNINRWKVTMLVWIFCAESLQRIAEAMNFCWAFAIALDGGNKASVPYLDIWIHFVLGHELFNVHLIACPMYRPLYLWTIPQIPQITYLWIHRRIYLWLFVDFYNRH